MVSRIHFTGTKYRLRNAADLSQAVFQVSARRMLKGPLRPRWNWYVEVVTWMLRKQVDAAFKLRDVKEARSYLDSVLISSPALSEVNIRPVEHEKFRGDWFSGKGVEPQVTLLYLHGGGYSFYPQAYASVIAQITLAAKARTFALDYRLTPEHRFPAQLNDALDAYRWLLENGVEPGELVVAGDSAGANLTLVLLLALREAKVALPASAIAISPPTDFERENLGSEEFDWLSKAALLQWRDWYCDPAQRCDPMVSPLRADLRGLPPIYIQAGRAEILYNSLEAFAHHARQQGADVILESWEDMNHNFPVFGPDAPQSVEALRRIGEVIEARVRGERKMETVSTIHG